MAHPLFGEQPIGDPKSGGLVDARGFACKIYTDIFGVQRGDHDRPFFGPIGGRLDPMDAHSRAENRLIGKAIAVIFARHRQQIFAIAKKFDPCTKHRFGFCAFVKIIKAAIHFHDMGNAKPFAQRRNVEPVPYAA